MFGNTTQYYYFDNIKFKESKIVIEPTIEQEKEYTKQEIFDYFVEQNKITDKYDLDIAIKILKKNELIYEPKEGVYKINKGDVNVTHA